MLVEFASIHTKLDRPAEPPRALGILPARLAFAPKQVPLRGEITEPAIKNPMGPRPIAQGGNTDNDRGTGGRRQAAVRAAGTGGGLGLDPSRLRIEYVLGGRLPRDSVASIHAVSSRNAPREPVGDPSFFMPLPASCRVSAIQASVPKRWSWPRPVPASRAWTHRFRRAAMPHVARARSDRNLSNTSEAGDLASRRASEGRQLGPGIAPLQAVARAQPDPRSHLLASRTLPNSAASSGSLPASASDLD
jgi:hypothetical protein